VLSVWKINIMKKCDQNHLLLEELRWWIDVWDFTLRKGRFWNLDVPELLQIDPKIGLSYIERRWLEARAQSIRILKEIQMEDQTFFKDKVVMSIGPGPVGFLEGCDASIKIAVEPLANRFQKNGLLLPSNDVIYLNTGAEHIPLNDNFVEIAVSRNSLDHVDSPQQVVNEIWRVLKPNGHFILNVDIEHEIRPLEPHSFSPTHIEQMLTQFQIVWKNVYEKSHGGDGRIFAALCIKKI